MSLYNFYDIISKCNKIPTILKIHLYHITLKHNINTQDLRQVITIMNKFINLENGITEVINYENNK